MFDPAHVSLLKRAACVAVAGMLFLTSPVQAQTTTCKAQWTGLIDLLHGAGLTNMPSGALVRELADGQCRVGGITAPLKDQTTVTAQSVTWGGEDMARFTTDGLPPRALNVTIKDMKLKGPAGNSIYTKRVERNLASLSGDVSLAAGWDEDARRLVIEHLSLHLSPGDSFVLQATVDNVDLRTKANMQMSFGAFLVSNLRFEFDTVGTFAPFTYTRFTEGFLGFPLEDPKRTTKIAEVVEAFPESLIDQPSKAALAKLFYDMSEAVGKARIELNATPGLGLLQYGRFRLARYSYPTPADFLATLQDVHVEVTYPIP